MTTAVTSFGPLVDRIYEALTTATGQPRALSGAWLMTRGYPPAPALEGERAMLARDATAANRYGTCFVMLGEKAATREDPELGSEHLWRVTLTISRDYYLDWFASTPQLRSTGLNEVRKALTRIDDHTPRIRAALCYPNAHDTVTETSAATGLATGSLIGGLVRTSTPQLSIVDRGARLANVIDTYQADVLWSPGS